MANQELSAREFTLLSLKHDGYTVAPTNKGMSWTDAVLAIMADGKPRSPREIAEIALKGDGKVGMVDPGEGRTPDRSVSTIIVSTLKVEGAKVEPPKVRKVGKGQYVLISAIGNVTTKGRKTKG
jgi:hypothetical protein